MKKLLLFLFLGLLSLSIASAFTTTNLTLANCYQESANVSTSCGGVSVGNYTYSGTWIAGSSIYDGEDKLVDGNYSTYSYDDFAVAGDANVTINYTKPAGSTSSSLWQVKFEQSNPSTNTTNLTLPLSCWTYDVNKITLKIRSDYNNGIYFYCLNASGWAQLTSREFPGDVRIYEEAMMWNGRPNNYSAENLSFYGNQNATRNLVIPQGAVLTAAYLNLSSTVFYQENADQTVVDNTEFLNPEYTYLFTNYTKPQNSTGLLWLVKHGPLTNASYNISINGTSNQDCWDYSTSKVTLKIESTQYSAASGGTGFSNAYCYNGTNYKTIGVLANTTTTTNCPGQTGPDPSAPELLYDGNFSTGRYYFQGAWRNESTCGATIWEEGVTWRSTVNNISNPSLRIGSTVGWSVAGDFNQRNNRTANLASIINSYLSSCSFVGGFCYVPLLFHSDTLGIFQYWDLLFDSTTFIENAQTYNSTTYETASESFRINITYDNSTFTSISANLNYNNTNYAGTQSGSGSTVLFTRTLDVPTISTTTSKSFFWNISLSNSSGTTYVVSTTNTQSIMPINLSICGAAPQNIPYINFTFKNETLAQETVKAAFSSTWSYYLGTGTYNETYAYTNTPENFSYAFCFSPQNRSVNIVPVAVYSNSESQQRSYTPTVFSVSNSTTNRTLYLLPTSLGQYVTFQVVNPAQQPVSGATVNISSSTFGLVEVRTTDGSGGATFFLNPLTTYTVSACATGYTCVSTTITPSQTSYTIQLGAPSSSSNISDYSKGITTTIKPTPGTFLNNNTYYIFNLTLASTYWNVDSFGFTLSNQTGGTIFASASSSSPSGGLLAVNISTGTNTTIVMNYFWVINSTYSNATVSWFVVDDAGSGFSIAQFVRDLRTYLDSGLFGLNDFALGLIAFILIMGITGFASYKFGLSSPAAILAVLFGAVFFFDVALGIVPNPVDAVPHFLTILVLVIFIAVLWKETTQ